MRTATDSEIVAAPGVAMTSSLRAVGWFSLLGVLLTGLTGVIAFVPLARALEGAFVSGGHLDLGVFARVLGDPAFRAALVNTGILMFTAGPLALFIGAVFAWLSERTNARLGWFSVILPIVPLLIPSIAVAVGWMFLANSRAGYLNAVPQMILRGLGMTQPGAAGPFDIATWGGMIFVYTIVLVPFVYLVVAAALQNTDSAQEEASRMCGAGIMTTLLRISLPSVVPALASSALLVLIVGSSLFSIPRTIGTAARIDTISVYIVRLTQVYPAKLDEAMAVSVLLLVVIALAWLGQQWVSRLGRHSTISGKSGSAAMIDLGRWRLFARIIMTLYVACVSILPFLALLVVALQPYWSAHIDPAQLTLDNFRDFFGLKGALPRRALMTSILLGVVGATISMTVVSVMVHFSRESHGAVSRIVEGVTKIPGAISHIVFGVAILVTFAGAPFNLSGTLTILLLAYYVIYLPQASTGAEVARGQVGNDLLEASSMLGATRFQTFRMVLLPLMLPGLTAGWALMFVVIVGDLTASAILAGHTNPVVSFVFLDIWDDGTFSMLATMGVLVSLVTSAVVTAALMLGRRAVMASRSSVRAGGG